MSILIKFLVLYFLGTLEIVAGTLFLNSLFQCRVRSSVSIHRKTFILSQILLIFGLIMSRKFEIQYSYWSFVTIISIMVAVILLEENIPKVIILFLLMNMTGYLFFKLILILDQGKVFWNQIAVEKRVISGIVFGIFLILSQVFKRFMNDKDELKQKIQGIGAIYYLIIFINIICCTYIVNIVRLAVAVNRESDLTGLCILSSVVFCIILLSSSFVFVIVDSAKAVSAKQTKLMSAYVNMQKEYYNITYQARKKEKIISTGLTENLKELKGLIQDEKLNETLKYISEIAEEINGLHKYSISTNKPIIDALIEKFLEEGKNKKVKIIVNGCFDEGLVIDDYDICDMLYSVISTGIDNCSRIKDEKSRVISIDIGRFKNCLNVRITNAFEDEFFVDRRKVDIDHIENSLCFESIKNISKKYNGLIDVFVSENSFFIEIVFLDVYRYSIAN